MTAEGAVVEARDLVRHYPGPGDEEVTALDGVSLTVRLGELVAVMGPSGSGKSTLLHMLGGLDTPTSGTVTVTGTELSGASRAQRSRARRRRIGYVFQDLNLIPSLRAIENVSLPLDLDGVGPRETRKAALDALRAVNVGDLAERFPDALSGGQQQRVAIARALVGPRRLLLADEPTGALDSVTGEEVMNLVRDRVDAGAAGVIVTHDARLAAWADRTLYLEDGRVVTTSAPGEPESLLEGV
ncbi:ATP-binding cassette domain-containing protein [Pseudactinotalea sp. HY160]|uniref:ABC transporter ATP-binding protein n=1 Tax=Pseudactinotalea sp. HY160 TaxID=2654490 RepID=UPI00128BA0D7|nr:ABC transporter ATP-binding protein [Pseudactinotalea sp. HY160]MPV48983.1 ATP-binding cassette domain-containing protein [Pseudactinotalea sp. HY160]